MKRKYRITCYLVGHPRQYYYFARTWFEARRKMRRFILFFDRVEVEKITVKGKKPED